MADQDEEPDVPQIPSTLVITNPSYQDATLQSLQMMRKNRQFCDVVLQVGTHEVFAHRAVLACASPYLFELFTTGDRQKGANENIITYNLNSGFEKLSFERLINYAYSGSLEIPAAEVKSVYLAAQRLKIDCVAKACGDFLITNLSIGNCIELRSVLGNNPDMQFVGAVDSFIRLNMPELCKQSKLRGLPSIQLEVLHSTQEEIDHVNTENLISLVLDWIRRQYTDEECTMDQLTERLHMLYVDLDNSLHDCCNIQTGDVNETELVQDYKKMSKRMLLPNTKPRRHPPHPAKPRVLLYASKINDRTVSIEEQEPDWRFVAFTQIAENNHLAVVTVSSRLTVLSIVQRLNLPSTPSPCGTPQSSRPPSMEKEMYVPLANMASERCTVGSGRLDGKLLVCGGYNRCECLRTCELYDPSTNQWKSLPNMREARGRFDLTVIGRRAYAVGGSTGTNELATAEVYDLDTEKWSPLPSMPMPRCHNGVCSQSGKIYCVGGWNGQTGIRYCHRLDPESNKWESIAPLNVGRYQAAVTCVGEFVFAIGGCDAWNCLNSVEVYNQQTDTWKFTAPLITARRGCGAAFFNDKLWVVGGTDGSHQLCTTEIYNPSTKTWSTGPNMTTCRSNVRAVVLGNRLYAVGGFSGKTFLTTIEYIDATTNEWSMFTVKPPVVTAVEDVLMRSVSAESEDSLQ